MKYKINSFLILFISIFIVKLKKSVYYKNIYFINYLIKSSNSCVLNFSSTNTNALKFYWTANLQISSVINSGFTYCNE
jgi:hypothetical protein